MEADAPSTAYMIESHFLAMRIRLDRARILYATGNSWDEEAATILVCCYLDWTASNLYKGKRSKEKFVQLLSEYSPEGRLGLYHPLLIADAFSKRTEPELRAIGEQLKDQAGTGPYELFTEAEAVDWIRSTARGELNGDYSEALPHGKLASGVYKWFRNRAVHGGGALPQAVTVGRTTTRTGAAVEPIDFELLAATLEASRVGALRISRETGLAYGRHRVVEVRGAPDDVIGGKS